MAQSITLQTSDSDIISSDVLGRLSFAASSESSGSDAVLIGASIYAMAESNFTEISNATSIIFATASSESAIAKLKISSQGHFLPILDKTYDIGASGTKFRNVFAENGKFENISISNLSDPYEILYITDSSGNVSSTDLLKVDVANTEIDLGGDLIPTSNLEYDLGSSSYKFRDTYTDKVILNSGSAIPATTSNTVYNVSGELYYNNNIVALLPSGGVQGQILQKYSTTSNILEWIDNFATEVRVYVKNTTGSALTKGQAVYINGAQGSHPTIALAIADGESSSSKTLGLLKQNLAINEFGYVVAEGALDGIDTSAASAAGDLIYLSPTTPGGLVYGLANRPTAPNHMVFIGYVVVKQQNNGKVFIKVQNGFELGELHNVATNGTANGTFLQYNTASGLWLASTSGNFTTLQVSTQTASTIASFNGDKSIVSLSTATYPSLTELSYVKGVTSALQTQIDSKAATSTTITAGSGIAGGGDLSANRSFDIGQGDGITVSADSIAVDSTVIRTTGVQTMSGAKTFSAQTVFASGTAAAPGISILGDTDTGIGQLSVNGTNSLSIMTSGVERVRFTSDGTTQVRANSSNISTLFTYNENGGELVHYDDTQAAATLLDQCNNQTRLLELINGSDLLLGLGGSNTTGSVRFMRAGFSEIMRINSSSNIGIGSSTNNDNIRTRLQICGPDADDDPSLGSGTGALLVTNSDNTYGIQFGVSADGVGWIQQGRVDGTATAYSLLLNPVGGNVGIGTSSPQQKFVVSNAGAEGMEIIPALNANESRIQTYNRSTSAWNKFSINCGTFELFTNGGTTTIFGNTSGNVGIGTSSPSTKLQINGQTRVTDGTTNIDFVSSSAVGYIGTQTNHPLVLRTNDIERMRITSAGNVDIGSNSDSNPTDTYLSLWGNVAGSNTTTGGIRFYNVQSNPSASPVKQIGGIYAARHGDNYGGSLSFLTANASIASQTLSTRMFIDSSGNVGIGTSSPTPKLHIYGAGSNTNMPSTTSSLGATIGVQDSGGASSNGGMIMFGAVQGFFAAIKGLITDGTPNTLGDLIFTTRNALGDSTLTERVRITSGGNFGIGSGATTPPELLSVMKDNNAGRTSILIDNLDQRLKMSCYYESGVGQYSEIQSTNNAETGHQGLILNRQGGNVAIGTATASYRLHVVGNASAVNNVVCYLNNTGGTRGRLAFQDTAVTYAPDMGSVGNSLTFDTVGVERVRVGNNGRTQFFAATEKYGVQLNNSSTGNGPFIGSDGADIFCISTAGGAERLRVNAAGELLIGTTTDNGAYLLQVNSQIYATNATIATSDSRFKTNVVSINNATSIIQLLRPVSFDFIPQTDRNFSSDRQIGLIAQEVAESLSNIDYKDSIVAQCGDHFGLAYEKLVPLLIKALQETNQELQNIKNRLSALEGE